VTVPNSEHTEEHMVVVASPLATDRGAVRAPLSIEGARTHTEPRRPKIGKTRASARPLDVQENGGIGNPHLDSFRRQHTAGLAEKFAKGRGICR